MKSYNPYTETKRRKKILIPLPNTGRSLAKKKQILLIRIAIIIIIVTLIIVEYDIFNTSDEYKKSSQTFVFNESNLYSNIPKTLRDKYFRALKNNSEKQAISQQTETVHNNDSQLFNISEIKRSIERYNDYQTIINEEVFGPLMNDSIIIVVQVHKRITYLRHLIVSLAQAKDISRTLLIFSHDFYDEEINQLVQSIDFCKVMQIFYPFSIQTHPNEFPGTDPRDCNRDLKKEQALTTKCQNALYGFDIYGHYREASFTQTKHHWWWKANRVFDQLEITRYHTGLVLFLEEDHYVAEDFLFVLTKMQKKAFELCSKCNILSLGTYLKTFNYYTYNNNHKKDKLLNIFGAIYGNSAKNNDRKEGQNSQKETSSYNWGYQSASTLYSKYQKVEVTPWISSKHNMGMSFNRTTWHEIKSCARFFCDYDDYNWDWSLQNLNQCLKNKLFAMVVRGPRVFHIGECGVHHKKHNCETKQIITKVQQVLNVAMKAGHFFPKNLMLTVSSLVRKQKLKKPNGGFGDKRDHLLCLNMTLPTR